MKQFTGIDKNGDGTIKRREARKFLKEHKDLKEMGIKKRDVIVFLNKAGVVSDGIEGFSGDKENGFTVEYKKDDSKKTIDKNGNYSDYDNDDNYDTRSKDDTLLSETKVDKETGNSKTTEFIDGDKNKVKRKTTVEKKVVLQQQLIKKMVMLKKRYRKQL